MRLLLALSLVCVLFVSTACQRRGVPYGGIDDAAQDRTGLQPDPAKIDK